MSVSYDHYRVFCAVASSGSITTAARGLFLSQPTVSRTIQSLEAELGCPLLLRSKSGVSLTPEGELLYSHAARALAHLQKAEEELKNRRTLAEGSVRIGASEMTLRNYLIPFLEAFRRRYPGIRLKIATCTTLSALSALKDGLIDFAIVISPIEEEGFLIQPLASFQDIVIAGERYFALKGQKLTLAQLVALPDCALICTDSATTSRSYLERFFAEHGVPLNPDIELAATDLITPMVARNLGIGIVPEQFARQELKEGKVIQLNLAQQLPPRQICLVQNPALTPSLAGKAFLEMMRPQKAAQEETTT